MGLGEPTHGDQSRPTSGAANNRRDPRALWLARRMLRLYPQAWRDRYEEEVTLVLRQSRVTGWTLLDFLLGALDARLHSDLVPGRLSSMAHRIRTSEITIFCAFMLYGLAWAASRFVTDPLPPWEHATALHPEILWSFRAMDAAGVIATLAFLVGGLPILWSVIRQTLRMRAVRLILALLTPVVLSAIFVVYLLLAAQASTARVAPSPNASLTPLAFALQMILLLLFFVTVGGGAAAVSYAVARSELSARLLRFALGPAAVAVVAMGVGLVATVVMSVLITVEAPDVSALGAGPVAIGIMLVGVVLAAIALRRGLRAARGGGDGAGAAEGAPASGRPSVA